MMNSTFITDEGKRQQDKHHDQDNALFVFRELENGEQTLHFIVVEL